MTVDESHTGLGAGPNTTDDREVVSFHRRRDLPGVEVRALTHFKRVFHVYSTDFEFFAPSSWQGELWHRRRQTVLGPGAVACAHPGEVFSARRIITPGAGHFLTIDARLFHEHLAEHAPMADRLRLRAVATMSPALDLKLREILRVVRPGPSLLELQSALVEFLHAALGELAEDSGGEAPSLDASLRTAERVRECLHFDSSATVDLSTLAKEAGVSRYQALRLFKRRYGLPPHTYQLTVRVALAQKALREGQQAVHVAMHCGFVDQSHFNRHFKRAFGVTPLQCARGAGRTSGVYLASRAIDPDPEELVARSDRAGA